MLNLNQNNKNLKIRVSINRSPFFPQFQHFLHLCPPHLKKINHPKSTLLKFNTGNIQYLNVEISEKNVHLILYPTECLIPSEYQDGQHIRTHLGCQANCAHIDMNGFSHQIYCIDHEIVKKFQYNTFKLKLLRIIIKYY